jgi:hypothetical protein
MEFRAQSKEVLRRTAADIEQENVAVAQLDVPGRRFLGARDGRRHAGAQRHDKHLIGAYFLRARVPGGRLLFGSILRHDLAEYHRQADQQNLL